MEAMRGEQPGCVTLEIRFPRQFRRECLISQSFGRRALSFYLLLVATAAAGACARSSQASDHETQIDARALFERACAKCHGVDGAGGLASAANGPKPIDLRDAAWQRSRSDDEIAAAIRDGRGAMPPFTDVLTPEQIGHLASYVRGLQRVDAR